MSRQINCGIVNHSDLFQAPNEARCDESHHCGQNRRNRNSKLHKRNNNLLASLISKSDAFLLYIKMALATKRDAFVQSKFENVKVQIRSGWW